MIDKPGEYALGSLKSRIAASAMLEPIRADRKKNLILVKIECIGHEEDNRTMEVYLPNGHGNR
jgi:hypothetical protein